MADGRILLVEADPAVAAPIRAALQREGYGVRLARSASRALAEAGDCDLALVSLALPETDGRGLVMALRDRRPRLPVIVLTPVEMRPQAFAAREVGAYAFLEVPHDLSREKIVTVVGNALEHRRLHDELAAARQVPQTLDLGERERQAVLAALQTTGWNKQAAAKLLNLHRPTLYAKMRKHGIPQQGPPGEGQARG